MQTIIESGRFNMSGRMQVDNDTLINQARQLYAQLLVKRYSQPLDNLQKLDRMSRLVKAAYGRYLRRLNRCVICYQDRLNDCNRQPGEDHTPCQPRSGTRNWKI